MNECGVVYVVYGDKARVACRKSMVGLRGTYPCAVVSDTPLDQTQHVFAQDTDLGARWPKLNIDRLSPYPFTAYLDADTLPNLPIETGFQMLEDGWDMVIAPSEKQESRIMWHLKDDERVATLDELGYLPLQLQGGVMFFQKNERVHSLFSIWREEWQRWEDKDQGALLRALNRVQAKIWLLGRPWNGGAVIAHHFGQAAREVARV